MRLTSFQLPYVTKLSVDILETYLEETMIKIERVFDKIIRETLELASFEVEKDLSKLDNVQDLSIKNANVFAGLNVAETVESRSEATRLNKLGFDQDYK